MGIITNKLKKYCKTHQGIVALIACSTVVVLIAIIFTAIFLAIPGDVSEIRVKQLPNKVTYIEGEKFNSEGLVIEARYNNGQKLEVDGWTYDIHDALKIADTNITISFGGVKSKVAITVLQSDVADITVRQMPNKITYVEGEKFSAEGLIIEAKYNNGKLLKVDGWAVDMLEALKTTDTYVTVSYGGATVNVPIIVYKRGISELIVKQMPDKVAYLEGENFNAEGLLIEAKHYNGQVQVVDGWTYDIHEALKITDTFITITYDDITVKIAITVSQKQLDSIEATNFPLKLSYKEGEYFDFLGLKLMANFKNSPQEEVFSYEWDITRPLNSTDTTINITYSLHGITKSVGITIVVEEKPNISIEQEQLDRALEILPSIEHLTIDDIDAIDYAIQLLNAITNLTSEQEEIKRDLENKRTEIINNLPPEPEKEYIITYSIANNLVFDDILIGNNPTQYKNSEGDIILDKATSEIAVAMGYFFLTWQYNNESISTIGNLTSDITIYALFELTHTVSLQFVDYSNLDTQVSIMKDISRSNNFNLLNTSVEGLIYQDSNKLPIAFYNSDGERITSIDLSSGAVVVVSVMVKESRLLHLADSESVTLSWIYNFVDNNGNQTTSINPQVNGVFLVPVDAVITMIALHGNISDILVDGVSKGEPLTSIIIKAVFQLEKGGNPISITFSTVLQEATTISFIGKNHQEVVYPKGWNGVMAKVDLDNLAFVYNENDLSYLNIYTIDGAEYYFDELSGYTFSGNTMVLVNQVYNSFSFKIIFANGKESFSSLMGRQTLRNALSNISSDNLELLNILLLNSLYLDSEFADEVSGDAIMDSILLKDKTLYSKYVKPSPPPPQEPTFTDVDYFDETFVGVWTSTFRRNSDILSSEISLTNDGYYRYKTFINGKINTDIDGQYRIENGKVVLKTFKLKSDYQLISTNDLDIDILCSADGIVRATFIIIDNTEVVKFDHLVTKGAIKPVNYSGQEFLKSYENNGISITLKANGTAEIKNESVTDIVYYRYIDGQFWIFSNGAFGTGNITDFVGGNW